MPINSMPPFASPVRSDALLALALRAGEVVEGNVVSTAASGISQVEIKGRLLSLLLPVAAKPGERLALQVEGSGARLQLSVSPKLVATSATTLAPGTTAPTVIDGVAVLPTTVGSANVKFASAVPPQVSNGSGSPTRAPDAPSTIVVAPQRVSSTAPEEAPDENAPNGTTVFRSASPAGESNTTPRPVGQMAGQPSAPLFDAAKPSGRTPAVFGNGQQARIGATMNLPAEPATFAPHFGNTREALGGLVRDWSMRQSSSAPLLSALASPAVRSALPQPVLLAAEQLGALQLPLAAGGIGGAALRNAILSSGIFREAMLASGTSPSPQGDVKSALLALRQSLVSWIGKQQPAAVVAVAAPPVRGAPPRARAADIPPIDPTSPPDEVGRQVLERTESSLARIRLQQHSSLPDSLASGKAEWNLELPVLIGLHQTSMQIQITRDQENSVPADQERGWQLRFAINLPTLGEVGAQVSLHGGATGVMLWAAEDETRQLMEQEMESLREQLQAAGLQPGSIILRQGVPTSPPLPSGHLLDSVS
jgi:hypothetical protein